MRVCVRGCVCVFMRVCGCMGWWVGWCMGWWWVGAWRWLLCNIYNSGVGESSVYDLWAHASIGTTSGGDVSAKVASHGVAHCVICPSSL